MADQSDRRCAPTLGNRELPGSGTHRRGITFEERRSIPGAQSVETYFLESAADLVRISANLVHILVTTLPASTGADEQFNIAPSPVCLRCVAVADPALFKLVKVVSSLPRVVLVSPFGVGEFSMDHVEKLVIEDRGIV